MYDKCLLVESKPHVRHAKTLSHLNSGKPVCLKQVRFTAIGIPYSRSACDFRWTTQSGICLCADFDY